jgi:FKBP-type peptidyl-prolyl cis-trans isomerase FkpA
MQKTREPRLFNSTLLVIAVGLVCATQSRAADEVKPTVFDTTDQELLYFWGTTFGKQLDAARVVDPKDIEWIERGLRDAATGKAAKFGDEYPSLLNNYLVIRSKNAAAAEAKLAQEYVKEMGTESGAITTPSGLVYRQLSAGSGAQPTKESRVVVHYTGTLRDGKVFDSSRERGEPLTTRLSAVIPCWTEGLTLMKAGGTAKITCPPELGYGERGQAKIPGGSALTFDVELIKVE